MKYLEKIIQYCDRDCPYYEWSYTDCRGDSISCEHDCGKIIYNNKEISTLKNKIYPITPPDWCPLKSIEDKGVKVSVSALFIKDNRVLIGKRIGNRVLKDYYSFPGGKMDLFEQNIEDALVREIKEETGVTIKKYDFISYHNEFFPDDFQNYIVFSYVVNEWEGVPVNLEPEKCESWEWIDMDNLPEKTSPYSKQIIKNYKLKMKE